MVSIGRSEFDAFAAKRRDAIDLQRDHGAMDHMQRRIKTSAAWPMPAAVVLAIAVKRGLAAPPGAPEAQRPAQSLAA